jgi:quercetin dioxygenase-like cupin family protein
MGQGADQELKIEAGSVFLLIPGVPHWYAPDPDTGWAPRQNR